MLVGIYPKANAFDIQKINNFKEVYKIFIKSKTT